MAGAGARKGFFAVLGIFLLGLLGLALVALAVLMPVGLRSIDPEVLAAAGEETAGFDQEEERWFEATKPGTAALFEETRLLLEAERDVIAIMPIREEEPEPALAVWGGSDPFLEQIFGNDQPEAAEANPPVLPLFIPRAARGELASFLESARQPAVRAVLANREVQSAEHFMPVASSAGQPLEATIYLTALLLQGNHFGQDMAVEIRRQAEVANEENHLGDIEGVYLDLLALGSKLQWQPLADLVALLEDRQGLRRTAHLVKELDDEWPVFVSAALWTRAPGELSRYLVAEGRSGLRDLKRAIPLGEGAVQLLVDRQEPVHAPVWRVWLPEAVPVVLADLGAKFPTETAILKVVALFSGILILFLALNLFGQLRERAKSFGRPFSYTFMQSSLLATACGVAFLFFTEPLLLEEGQKSEFRLSLPISIASGEAQPSTEEGVSINMDQITIISLAIFFSLQLIVYLLCWIKVMEIRRQPIASQLKLKLLENEEHLFDTGLYLGLAGTVGALIFLAIGIVGPSLMSAYASTLFGIVFVAMFKICHLRPYRRRLIIESQVQA